MKRKLTILVAMWKAGRFLQAKIDNLKRLEGFENCWVVLLNCQNHDRENEVYHDFVEENDNVLAIQYDNHVNLYPTWNDGIKATESDYIMNSNVDDMLHPTFANRCCGWLDSHQEYACVSTRVLVTYKPNQPDASKWEHDRIMPFKRYPHSSAGPCPVWRRSLHEKYGYFGNYRVIGDARMWERWHAGKEQFGLIKEDLVLYYRYNRSLEMRFIEDKSDPNFGKLYRDIDIEEDHEATKNSQKTNSPPSGKG